MSNAVSPPGGEGVRRPVQIIGLTDAEWHDVKVAAAWMEETIGELVAAAVRDFLNDPRKSPLVKAREGLGGGRA